MSGTPSKRLHEEMAAGGGTGGGGGVGQNSGSSKYPHEDSGAANPSVGPKVAPPVSSAAANEYHHHAQPFDHMGQQDGRIPSKIARNEPTSDRWSQLLPMYHHRLSSSSNDLHSDHPVAAENRPESRNSKDNVRDHKVENRETGELLQSGKESRGDDNKEAKFDRDRDRDRDAYHSDYKGENLKVEKEGYGVSNSLLNWKESKEHHRGKRYPDTPGGNADSWHASRSTMHGPHEREVAKEGSVTEERDYIEPHEAVGENKVDFKGEDRFKDKDRKRKESKHRDWGERDKDRNERRNNLQLGNSSGEGKEPVREEREVERWDRERKDLSKDKEKLKEREKDHVKKEAWNGAEKDGLPNEKESMMDISGRTIEQENSTLEQRKQKDHDGWKNVDREAKERRKERDGDAEGERPEKRSRCYDKESDDGCADAEGVVEKEREVFNYGVQQRKRMLRPRGSPQVNREPRFRSRTQDNEGYAFNISLLLV